MKNISDKYICPMHPDVVREREGMCPECGMNLVVGKGPSHSEGPHDKHKGHSLAQFARKFWVSFVLTVPVVLYSGILEALFGFRASGFNGSIYLPIVFSTIIFFYGGWIFLSGARRELIARQPGMMTLIALAITVAYSYSVISFFTGGETLFWELSSLITIMLLGHYLEMRAVQGVWGALKALSRLLPDEAEVMRGTSTRKIALEQLKKGDVVLIRPGTRIPADGIVVEGVSDVNEAMITGEARPVSKKKGSEVIAGTVNAVGSLKIRVTKIGKDTFLSGIMRLVNEAQSSKSRLQLLSDRAAFYLTLVALFGGVITFIVWLTAGAGAGFAIERTVAVLVIACPHALGLAIPLVATISTTKAASNGFLVRERLALEEARNIDTVLFDKTGTLTEGKYGVTNIWNIGAKGEAKLIAKVAGVESFSEHFTAQAIVEYARQKKIKPLKSKDFTAITGQGVQATVGGQTIKIGGVSMLGRGMKLPKDIAQEVAKENKTGKSIIYIIAKRRIIGVIALADIIRQESREAIEELKKRGVKTAMITGDSRAVADWVAYELGLDEYYAQVRPEDKSAKVYALQKNGRKVAMVGDGINDAPALAAADVGIAIGAGTNVAVEAAGIVLVKNDPRDIVKIIRLSKMTYRRMLENLFWATGYNVFALPIAAGVLIGYGIILEPSVGAIFMSASTMIVAARAMALRGKSLD